MTVFTASTDYVCDWLTSETCPADALTAADSVIAQRAVDFSAEILYALSGRQFGLCQHTIRPCMEKCCDPCDLTGGRVLSGLPWIPLNIGGFWYNVHCTCRRNPCSCTQVCEVRLPGPVSSIVQVRLNGDVLDPNEYRVDNRNRLLRLTNGCWPTCQDMSLAPTEDNTWEVTYLQGKPLPAAGSEALTLFANEIVKAFNCDKTCALPARTTNVIRQGLSFTVLDKQEFLDSGRTGLLLPDLWLKAVNPKARTRQALIMSPDFPEVTETTWSP